MTRRAAARRAFDAAFIRAADEMLRRLGAEPTPHGWPGLRLQTRAGELLLHVYGGWLATRFDDVPRAVALLNPRLDWAERLNPLSGKWNFHFGPEDRVEDAVALVEAELRTITNAAQVEGAEVVLRAVIDDSRRTIFANRSG